MKPPVNVFIESSRGLIIRNRSVWSTLFLFSVFTALKGTIFFYISKHFSRLKLVVFLIALFMVLVHVSVGRATVWKRKFYHGPAVIDILNKYMYRYTLESNIPGKLKLFYFSFFDLR